MVHYAETLNRGALRLKGNQARARGSLLKRAEFFIPEFPEFISPGRRQISVAGIGTPEREILQSLASRLDEHSSIAVKPPAHHIVLDSGNGWEIRLTRDEQLTRGLVGHTGLIEDGGGREYSVDELEDMLEGLKYFLAFAAGAYCHPTVVIGYDSQDRPAWGQIGRLAATGHDFKTWFSNVNVRYGPVLERLFSSFWSSWTNDKDGMAAVIECYVHSNSMQKAGVPDDAVAKSYAGLEILASMKLKRTIRGDSSKDIHKVLSGYEIPHLHLTLEKTPAMTRLSEDLGEIERRGCYVLGDVRNYIVHPLDPSRPAEVKEKFLKYLDADVENYFYLHDLSQFYLEYALLKYLGCEPGSSYRKLLETLQQVK